MKSPRSYDVKLYTSFCETMSVRYKYYKQDHVPRIYIYIKDTRTDRTRSNLIVCYARHRGRKRYKHRCLATIEYERRTLIMIMIAACFSGLLICHLAQVFLVQRHFCSPLLSCDEFVGCVRCCWRQMVQ